MALDLMALFAAAVRVRVPFEMVGVVHRVRAMLVGFRKRVVMGVLVDVAILVMRRR